MSNFRFTRGSHLSLSLKVLKLNNQANEEIQRSHLSATFCALKQWELEAEEFKNRRSRISEMLLMLKWVGHDKPKPISEYKIT